MNRNKAILLLQDGACFEGKSVGAEGETIGEVVFNTSMTGYQEVLSDPSYKGQIVLMTYPHIGNYGINEEDMESAGLWLEGFAMGECCRYPSNYRSRQDLNSFLAKHAIVSIDGIDTRKLTRHIRDKGAQPGIISTTDFELKSLLRKLKDSPHPIDGKDLVSEVTCKKPYLWDPQNSTEKKFKVAAYDFGIKYNILRLMTENGMEVEVFPAAYDPENILAGGFDGVFLSNGPGNPEELSYAVKHAKQLLGKLPMFGICLGNQIMGISLGGQIKKLAFGHHGSNQPVMELKSKKVEITAQNHNFVLDFSHMLQADEEDSTVMKTQFGMVQISHINLNDNSVEGMEFLDVPAFSVQYHPEASPGPHDSKHLFKQFANMMEKTKK